MAEVGPNAGANDDVYIKDVSCGMQPFFEAVHGRPYAPKMRRRGGG